MPKTTAPTGGRIAWLDLARAISILLVVLYHAGPGTAQALLTADNDWARHLWRSSALALIPLRMPLFFLISGVLAARAVHRPWRATLRSRILDLLWPYALWSVVFGLTAWPRYAPGEPFGYFTGELTGMLVMASPYWFIAALPLFFAIARLGRQFPRVLLALSLVGYASAPYVQSRMAELGLPNDLMYGVFQVTDNLLRYVLGVAASPLVIRVGEARRPALGALLLAVFVVLAALTLLPGAPMLGMRALEFAASVTGLAASALLIPALARRPVFARLGTYLGARTLVIYLVHPLALNVLIVALTRYDIPAELGEPWRGLLMVPAVAVIAVVAALLVDRGLEQWGPAWVLQSPFGPATPESRRPPSGTRRQAGPREWSPRGEGVSE